MSVATEGMRGMSDTGLLDLYRSGGQAEALAEAARRDRADKASRALKAIRDEWEEAAYAQYLTADAECRGNLLSAAGKAAGIVNEFSLWRHRAADAKRFASEELNEFWLHSPRVSVQQYMRQRAAAMRAAREDITEEAASDEHSMDAHGRAGLDRDAARGLRTGRAAGAVRRTGNTAVTQASADGRERAGSIQRGGERMSVTGDMSADARTAAHLAAGKARAAERLGEARERTAAMREVTGTVARRPATPPARAAERIPGDQLLDLLRQWLGTYARYPSAAALDAVTLWVAHSHMKDESGTLVFRATPRLYLLSSEPGSGKSKVLELLNMLCPDTFGLDLEPTKAGLIHTISKEHATVLLDEGDLLFASSQRASGTRAVLNGGYARHGTTVSGKGNKATRVNVFGAVALAGLDVMEKATGNSLDALLSRGFKIRMKRAGKDDRPAKVSRVSEGQAAKLNEWLQAWASQVRDGIKDYQPDMPEELDSRAEEISEPLVAVADAAGGDWPERARAACLELALAQDTAPVEDGESVLEEFASFADTLGGELAGTVPDYGDDGEE